jgi:hypothetical protein
MTIGEWSIEITAYEWLVLLVAVPLSASLLLCVIALLTYVIHTIWAAARSSHPLTVDSGSPDSGSTPGSRELPQGLTNLTFS